MYALEEFISNKKVCYWKIRKKPMYKKAALKSLGETYLEFPSFCQFLDISSWFRMTNDIINLFSISKETFVRFYCLPFFWKVWIIGPLGLNVSPKDLQFFPTPSSVHCWEKNLLVLIRPHPWVCFESKSKTFQSCYLI